MGDVHRGETTNVMYAGRIAEVGHPGDHVMTVQEGIFISYGLRSFGLTFRTAVSAARCARAPHCRLHSSPKVGLVFSNGGGVMYNNNYDKLF